MQPEARVMDSEGLNSNLYFATSSYVILRLLTTLKLFFSLLLSPSKKIPIISKIFFFINSNNKKSW